MQNKKKYELLKPDRLVVGRVHFLSFFFLPTGMMVAISKGAFTKQFF